MDLIIARKVVEWGTKHFIATDTQDCQCLHLSGELGSTGFVMNLSRGLLQQELFDFVLSLNSEYELQLSGFHVHRANEDKQFSSDKILGLRCMCLYLHVRK